MRILHTPVRFYPYVGGVENYVMTLGRQLVKKKHEVTVVCANEPAGTRDDTCHGIRIERLTFPCKIANTNITPFLPWKLMKEDYDVIHTHVPTPWSADWSALIAWIKKTPLVVTYHNDIAGDGIYRSVATIYNRTFLQCVLKRAGQIIITSPDFRSTWLGPYRDKIVVVPNSVDTGIFYPATEPKIGDIFFLGVLDQYHRYKGLDYLLGAVRYVLPDIPDLKLIVGGSGIMKEYYLNLSRSLGISEHVEFVGYIPDKELPRYYNGCSVTVLPSTDPTREGFGIVLLEAMACGKPVITTGIAGVARDITDRSAGKVVPPENAVALGDAIKAVLLDPERADEMGSAGREIVREKYSSDRVADSVISIYERLRAKT
jgi:glycosyltransferase involved in cell wall biosynthesis